MILQLLILAPLAPFRYNEGLISAREVAGERGL